MIMDRTEIAAKRREPTAVFSQPIIEVTGKSRTAT